MSDLPSVYNPKLAEEKWYKFWEENNLFRAKPNPEKKPYCIVIPPPNITGILHMGHALNNTIQDILIRYKRMKGFEALWMPGTDHAGIATQNVVEKKLAKEGKKRQDVAREKFLELVWQWKDEYGSTIIKQLKKMGSSCDWERLRFTMDEEYSKSILDVFVLLYEKGLIYRGNYIINWCPRCQTALSDEEAPHHEVEGSLYYVKYPLKSEHTCHSEAVRACPEHSEGPKNLLDPSLHPSGSAQDDTQKYIIVATTRPETMLGDTAVAVNPKDKRYKKLIGKTLILPLIEREIKIIADEMVDMKFGTGAVKVTPAHDPNDYALGKKHNLEFVNIMNPDGVLNANAGEYDGMDRFEAREVILEDLKEKKLLQKTEPHRLSAGHCYRCHTIIEPYLSKQWFVKMKPLAKPAIEAVKKGKIKFYPERWTKVYLNWMDNIQNWCISRQIWWGHRLPVYYCKSCQVLCHPEGIKCPKDLKILRPEGLRMTVEPGVIVSRIKPDKCPVCGSADIYQDEDVLDTWFSSWLWPFATFKDKADLKYFYPTSALITAQEIIFFWVARMIMAGFEFQKDIPFKDVYIHGTVRDDTGKKMSKSLGNIIDPLEIIDEFGADALRFSIISITAVGQDVFLSKQKFELGRNFANKIWNASRFIITNLKPENIKVDLCVSYTSPDMNLADKWILSRFYQMLGNVEKSVDNYRFNEAAGLIYEFFWHEFCDWYIEFSKPYINEPHTQIVLYKVLEKSLRVLHPLMPFITEEIWHNLNVILTPGTNVILSEAKNLIDSSALHYVQGRLLRPQNDKGSIMTEKWPHIQEQMINKKVDTQMQLLMDAIITIRNIRASWNINPSVKVNAVIKAKKKEAQLLMGAQVYIKNLARVETITIEEAAKKPPKSAAGVIGDMEIYIPLEGIIDLKGEKERLEKKIEELSGVIKGMDSRLKNKNFTSKAPTEIVEKEKTRKLECADTLKRLKDNLKDLG